MSNALDHAGHNCNLLTQAESLVMTKEYAIDHYGTVRWTIGSGCSGGSLAQQQVANAYPGVYQGITPQCSFTDAWSSAMQYEEYYFGLQFLENPARWGPGVVYDPVGDQRVLRPPEHRQPDHVHDGDPELGRPVAIAARASRTSRSTTPQTNPGGVRCTLQDYMVNAFGRDERGWARRGFDNVGIQYGLKGLRQGLISPAQFVDFNAHIGGGDLDLNITAGAHGGRPDRAAAPVPDRRDQLGQQPRPGRDHRPARPRPRRLPRRLPHLRDAGAARAQLRHRGQPGPVARAWSR